MSSVFRLGCCTGLLWGCLFCLAQSSVSGCSQEEASRAPDGAISGQDGGDAGSLDAGGDGQPAADGTGFNPTFVVGYNFGDDSVGDVVLDGDSTTDRLCAAQGVAGTRQLGLAAVGGTLTGWSTDIAPSELDPAVDADLAELLNNHISVSPGGSIVLSQGLTSGKYLVYTYHLENNETGRRSYDIVIQGQVMTDQPIDLAHYQWVRAGPFEALVTEGVLEIQVRGSEDSLIAGLEIFTTTGGQVQDLPTGPGPGEGQPDPGTLYVPAGYSLVFSDEFDGPLDTDAWNTLAPWGVPFYSDSDQKHACMEKGVIFHDGIVSLEAKPDSDAAQHGQAYSAGCLTTNAGFTHGYYELRARLPAGQGLWPAFWLTSSTRWPPEWDIFEVLMHEPTRIYQYDHPAGGGTSYIEGPAENGEYTGIDTSDGYHIYGFLWTSNEITWFVDGVLTRKLGLAADAGGDDAMWLNLSLQVGGTWPGDPDATTPWPARMDCDYVRLYQP